MFHRSLKRKRGRLWPPCSSRLYFIVPKCFWICHKSLPLTHDAVPAELDLLGSDGGSDGAARARLLQLHGISQKIRQRPMRICDFILAWFPPSHRWPYLPNKPSAFKRQPLIQEVWGRGGTGAWRRVGGGGWVMGVQGSR